ncbi:MAG: peptidyl-prolyl cis-trans isomerase [Candidatus Sumerlaeota bacterium]|nr:peptidyl-prolyl cis-trans isomerase [Candidatus Sumerlaeota bacterium]
MKKTSTFLATLAAAALLAGPAVAQESKPAQAPATTEGMNQTSPRVAMNEATEAVAEEAPAATEEKEEEEEKELYATVDGRPITMEEVDKMVDMQLQGLGNLPPAQLEQFRAGMRDRAGDQLIMQNAIMAYIQKNELGLTDEEKAAKIAEVTDMIGGEEAVKEVLAQEGLSRAEFEQQVADFGAIQKLAESVPAPTEEEIGEAFEANKAKFSQPEEVTASHILLGFESGDSDEQKAEKKKKIEELRAKVLAGEDFAALAKEYSTCPSRARGGDLGSFTKGRMVPAFEEAAFKLEEGKVSDVVETQFGYHIIKVTKHQKAAEPTLENAREDIINMIKEQKMTDLVAQIRKNSKVVFPGAEASEESAAPAATN